MAFLIITQWDCVWVRESQRAVKKEKAFKSSSSSCK